MADLWRRTYDREPRMAMLAIVLLVLAVPTLLAHVMDSRSIAGGDLAPSR